MTVTATSSQASPWAFTLTSSVAALLGFILGGYFLAGSLLTRQVNYAVPATVLRAAHYAGNVSTVRLLWTLAVLVGVALVAAALVSRSSSARGRRPLLAGLAVLGLTAISVSLPVSPAHFTLSWRATPMEFQPAGAYVLPAVLCLGAAVSYVSLAIAVRVRSGKS